MAAEYEKREATSRFLQRQKSIDDIKQIAAEAFANLQGGVQMTTVTFEGGSGGGQINCETHILLNACEDALVALGDADAIAAQRKGALFTQFSGSILQT